MLGFDGAEHEEFWALFVGYMFAALRPTLPYFVLCLGGEQGTGKSTTAKVIRAFVDPHDTDIQPKPRTEDDLFVELPTAQWLTAYDNLSTIDAALERRVLPDLDRHRLLASASSTPTATRCGSRWRGPRSSPRSTTWSRRRTCSTARSWRSSRSWTATPRTRPSSWLKSTRWRRGCSASCSTPRRSRSSRQKVVKLRTVPRMVGPTKWIEAAAEVLGLAPGQFLEAYLDSQARAGELALESSLIGVALVDMLHGRDAVAALAEQQGKYHSDPVGFEGTAKDLLHDLNEFMRGKPTPRPGLAADAQGHGQRASARSRRRCASSGTWSPSNGQVATSDRHRNITIDTPLSHARRSAHNANDSSHSSHSSQHHPSGDGGNDGNGDLHTQRNGDHVSGRDGRERRVSALWRADQA